MTTNQNAVAVREETNLTATPIHSRTGNLLGQRFTFGKYSAAQLKASIKASRGLKGKALTKAVNEALNSEAAARKVYQAAVIAKLEVDGFVFDLADEKAEAALMKFVRPVKVDASAKAAKAESKAAALKSELEAAQVQNAKLMERLAALEKLAGMSAAQIEGKA